jgi:hypothetical protein
MSPEPLRTPDAGADPRRMHTSEAALLPAGTIVRIASAGTVRVEHRPLPEVESQLTWRTGTLVFHNQPLGEVVTEINRYNRRHFVITDPALATLSFGGNLKPIRSTSTLRVASMSSSAVRGRPAIGVTGGNSIRAPKNSWCARSAAAGEMSGSLDME